MAKPQGTLTGAQLEIMEAVWAGGRRGVTVAEIWDRISRSRHVARTTVLTLVRRLQQRGWLARKKDSRSYRYSASRSRERATGRLAARFVDEFFGGSAAELVMSLLGSNRIGPKELKRLRDALAEAQEANTR
jgi:BlaI family penicillinase repressor